MSFFLLLSDNDFGFVYFNFLILLQSFITSMFD